MYIFFFHIFIRLVLGIVSLLVGIDRDSHFRNPYSVWEAYGRVPSLGVPINSMDVCKQVFVWVCTYVYIYTMCVCGSFSFIHSLIHTYLFIH